MLSPATLQWMSYFMASALVFLEPHHKEKHVKIEGEQGGWGWEKGEERRREWGGKI
jgi:hypothetical protein